MSRTNPSDLSYRGRRRRGSRRWRAGSLRLAWPRMRVTHGTADPRQWPGEPEPGRLVMDLPGYGEPDPGYGEPEQIWPADSPGYGEPRQANPDDGPASPSGYGPTGYPSSYGPSGYGPSSQDRAGEGAGPRWRLALARRSWPVIIGASAVVSLIVISVTHIVSLQPLRALMTDCGTVSCHSALPVAAAPDPSASVSAHIPSAAPSAAPSPPVATPEPSSPPSASMAAATTSHVPVTVHYHVLFNLFGSVVGKFTIINDSSSYITGWQLTAVFPGDQVQTVIGADDPDPGSDVLIMDAPPGSAIPPGGKAAGIFVALGHRAHPASCTLDGMAC